jgi:hypothetical protein
MLTSDIDGFSTYNLNCSGASCFILKSAKHNRIFTYTLFFSPIFVKIGMNAGVMVLSGDDVLRPFTENRSHARMIPFRMCVSKLVWPVAESLTF